MGTVRAVREDPSDVISTIRRLHAEAESGLQRALVAVRSAELIASSQPWVTSSVFEYGEASRCLRAALTALLSAEMDLDGPDGTGPGSI